MQVKKAEAYIQPVKESSEAGGGESGKEELKFCFVANY